MLVHCDIRKHINRCFEYEKIFGSPCEMKAVFSDTVVHIAFEIRFCRGRSLLCVDRYSFRIFSNEDSIMVIRIFIDESVLYKTIENLTVDQSCR